MIQEPVKRPVKVSIKHSLRTPSDTLSEASNSSMMHLNTQYLTQPYGLNLHRGVTQIYHLNAHSERVLALSRRTPLPKTLMW